MKRSGEVLKNKYLFFRFDYEDDESNKTLLYTTELKGYNIEQFIPSFTNLKKHDAKILIYIFWFIVTGGKYKIIYLKKDDEIIHYTHILPKFFKLPFLDLNDLEIGPSWTKESYRGQGIFPVIINYITHHFKKEGRSFHILARIENLASQNAIKKTGFYIWAKGYKTDFFGIYKMEVL